VKLGRACIAGIVGTAFMTFLMLALPHLGLPRLAIGEMLGSASALTIGYTAVGATVGWVIHGVVGVILALGYAAVLIHRLPGSPVARGLAFGVILFFLAQIVFMPFVGAGFFSRGDIPMILGSLLGHLVYGGLVGVVYGTV
jgi:uncharacterized membrane protein YagU involved in acid resistance